MKKFISTLFVLVGLVSFSFAQEVTEIAQTRGATELAKSKTSGEYVLTMPNQVTNETVESNAKYYTSVMNISFDESSHVATINMLSEEAKDRFVMVRFLTACGVRYVEVDDKNLELYDFANEYLK